MTVFESGRPKYGRLLEKVLDRFDVNRVLTLIYDIDKRGRVQIDVWTFRHGAYSFRYEYGNLDLGRDKWDDKTDEEIMDDMKKSAQHFATLRLYHVWRAMQLMDQ